MEDELLSLKLCLPADEPFTRRQALDSGHSDRTLRGMVDLGVLSNPIHGVYVSTAVPDSLELRTCMLALVVPPDAFVTDRTAGWLHGANMILAPNDHLSVPKVSMFHLPRKGRTRLTIAESGERAVRSSDLMEVSGLLVTTPLRTALDLGRRLPRAQALSALDSMLGLKAFDQARLLGCVERFAKQRGVRQLRVLAPLADGRAASPGESALRLLWYDAGLPRPELQIPIVEDGREVFYLDIGLEGLRFAAEYDGREWHSEGEDVSYDLTRRTWLREQRGWHIEVATAVNVYGAHRDADWQLRAAYSDWVQSRPNYL